MSIDKLKFTKVHKDVKAPTRANDLDAGLDVYWCPPPPPLLLNRKYLEPGENCKFETGIKVEVPEGYMLQVMNRSSIAANYAGALIVGAHVIDSGYEGEIFVDLHNICQYRTFIQTGDKIAQLVLVPVETSYELIEVPENELYNDFDEALLTRKEGTLGSSDDQ